MTRPDSGFRLAGASARVAGRTLLEAADLHLPPGRICGVIGRNGAGKSTLLRLLARHLAPAGGRITLDGQDIAAMADRAYARRAAYMTQGTPPVESMTVRDLVTLGRYPWHGAMGRMRPGDHAAVAAALERTALATMADRVLGTLSGGELQRARLAMMLAQEAGWLILDEPSAALDLAWSLDMLTQLRALADEGRGVILALHDMNLAARFCDDLLAVRSGRIVAHGPTETVFRPELLSMLFDVEITVVTASGQPLAIASAPVRPGVGNRPPEAR